MEIVDSKDRALKRCLANEHDSTIHDDLYDGALNPVNYADLPKRVSVIPLETQTEESDMRHHPMCVDPFPPTQTETTPTGLLPGKNEQSPEKLLKNDQRQKKENARPASD